MNERSPQLVFTVTDAEVQGCDNWFLASSRASREPVAWILVIHLVFTQNFTHKQDISDRNIRLNSASIPPKIFLVGSVGLIVNGINEKGLIVVNGL